MTTTPPPANALSTLQLPNRLPPARRRMPSLRRPSQPIVAVGLADSSSVRILRPASIRPMRLDSSIAVALCTKLPHHILLSLHQQAEFLREFDVSRTATRSVQIRSGCGHATSTHMREHPACASSFRCQTTALSRGSSFDRIGCLPTRRKRAGAGQPCPGAVPTRLQTWEMLVGPFVVDICPAPPVAFERHRDCLAALPPRFRVLLLRPRSQTPAFQAPARYAGTGHHPGCQSPSPVRTSLRSIVHVA